jgi:hypothetical protein
VSQPEGNPAPAEIELGGVTYIRKDLFDAIKFTAELNAETIKQMQAADAAEHEEFIARFGL